MGVRQEAVAVLRHLRAEVEGRKELGAWLARKAIDEMWVDAVRCDAGLEPAK